MLLQYLTNLHPHWIFIGDLKSEWLMCDFDNITFVHIQIHFFALKLMVQVFNGYNTFITIYHWAQCLSVLRSSHILECVSSTIIQCSSQRKKTIQIILVWSVKHLLWIYDLYMLYWQAFYLIYYIHELRITTHNYYRHYPATSMGVKDCHKPKLQQESHHCK